MCILNIVYIHDWGPNNITRKISTSISFGMDPSVLWCNIPLTIIFGLVTRGLFSIFSMGKLTQSQKALFLWRNPISYSKK
jgi:hypothetical protein